MSFYSDVFIGLELIGTMLFPRKLEDFAEKAPFVLTGQYDRYLRAAFFYNMEHREPQSTDSPELAQRVAVAVENVKNVARAGIAEIFKAANFQDEMEKKGRGEEIAAEFRDHNVPHEMGTVAEIAAKYGISKSEVRRRKADGTLNELQAKAA